MANNTQDMNRNHTKNITLILASLIMIVSKAAWSQSGNFYQCNPNVFGGGSGVVPGYGQTAVEAATDYCTQPIIGDSYYGQRLPESNPTLYHCVRPSSCWAFQRACESIKVEDYEKAGCVKLNLHQQCGSDVAGDKETKGNPCHVATGNKSSFQNDLRLSNSVYVTRSYNSEAVKIVFTALSGGSGGSSSSARSVLDNISQVGFGRGWISNLHKKLIIQDRDIVHVSSHSRLSYFANSASSGRSKSRAGSAVVGIVMDKKEEGEGIDILLPNGVTEHYSDVDGRLLYEKDINGNITNYIYTGDLLTKVEDHFGKAIAITYNSNNLVESITDPSGAEYRYGYEENEPSSGQFNLTSVTYPGSQSRHYHYEDPVNPSLLTGISDENGDRYATYAYNDQGKAILTEYAQTTSAVPQERFELEFQEQVEEDDGEIGIIIKKN